MHNFVFHNPTKVLFGRGTIPQAGAEACAYGRRVLLVYGRNSAERNGLLQLVTASLQEAGAEIIEFGGVQPNPTLDHVRAGIQLAKQQQIDVVCALGGGSVIDTAKAISAGTPVEHDVWKFFTGKKSIRQTIPLIAVSTLAASGSEMNSGMVLTNTEKQQKFGFGHRLLFPKVAIMDPETTYTVSPAYTAYGAVDAFTHLLEFYMTTKQPGTIVQDRYIEGLAKSIMASCDMALAEPESYPARAALMWSATLALNGLSAAGLGKVGFPMHLIEHSLSALHDIPHGAGLGIVVPGWLRYHAKCTSERISMFFEHLFGRDMEGTVTATDGIDHLEGWLRKNNVPTTLQEVGISPAEIGRLAENALPLAKIWRMKEYDREKIESILRCCSGMEA